MKATITIVMEKIGPDIVCVDDMEKAKALIDAWKAQRKANDKIMETSRAMRNKGVLNASEYVGDSIKRSISIVLDGLVSEQPIENIYSITAHALVTKEIEPQSESESN